MAVISEAAMAAERRERPFWDGIAYLGRKEGGSRKRKRRGKLFQYFKRAAARGGDEDRFEKKGADYQARVRAAYRQIAATDQKRYCLIDANRSREEVSAAIVDQINRRFALDLRPAREIA